MATFTKELLLGNKGYKISYDLNSLHHLCIARELSNLKLISLVKNERFNSWDTDRCSDPTELDYKVFLDLFLSSLRTHLNTSQTLSILYTMSTGEVTRWGYTREQSLLMTEFLELLPIKSSMILHSTPRTGCYSLDPNEDSDDDYSGIEEVTLFSIDYPKLVSEYVRSPEVQEAMTPPPEPPTSQTSIPTESAIREFLRSL